MLNAHSKVVQPTDKNNRIHIRTFSPRKVPSKAVPLEEVPDRLSQDTKKKDEKTPPTIVPPTKSGNVTINASTNAILSPSKAQPKASGNAILDSSMRVGTPSSPKIGTWARGLGYAGYGLAVLPVIQTTYKSIAEASKVEINDINTPDGLNRQIDDTVSRRRINLNGHLDIVRTGLSVSGASIAGGLVGTLEGIGTAVTSLVAPPLVATVPYVVVAGSFAASENRQRIELMQKYKIITATRDMYQSLGKAENIRKYVRTHPHLDKLTIRQYISQAKGLEKRATTISAIYHIPMPKINK